MATDNTTYLETRTMATTTTKTTYTIERCRSQHTQSSPMSWEPVATHADEQTAIGDLHDWQKVCHASGDAFRITVDGVQQDIGCDDSGLFLVAIG